jgi:hypothetical protein
VAVRVFALAAIAAQGVPGGKGIFYADFKHCWVVYRFLQENRD